MRRALFVLGSLFATACGGSLTPTLDGAPSEDAGAELDAVAMKDAPSDREIKPETLVDAGLRCPHAGEACSAPKGYVICAGPDASADSPAYLCDGKDWQPIAHPPDAECLALCE